MKKLIIVMMIVLLVFNVFSIDSKAETILPNRGVAAVMDESYETLLELTKSNPYCITVYNLTDEEKEMIYKITYAESGNQEIEGQRAVIEVILNRLHSEHYPNTVEEVLSQSGQFSTWKKVKYIEYNEEQVEALKMVCNEDPILDDPNYMYFNGTPFKNTQDNIQIGDHWFGKHKNKK